MATTITAGFTEFKRNLEITDRQTALVSTRRTNVVDAIDKQLWLHTERSKVIGSWDRDTLTRYLSEGDEDVMVILDYSKHSDWDTSDGTIKVLDRFKAILDTAYPSTTKRRDRNCISMSFSEFRLDVVPAFKSNTGDYKIPDSIRKQWVYTNPIKFAEKITGVNKVMGGCFVPLIKMVKGWNRDVGWPIRSFHLECLLHYYFSSWTTCYTYPFMLKSFFGALPGYLAGACYDPVSSDRVDTYLDNAAATTRRQIAKEKARAAASASQEAYDDQEKYPSVAYKEWKALMGEFFPAYG
jgi:hypothetical protein